MYTVLLADDEATVLETLATAIHWQQFGVSTILTVADGKQALDVMSHQKVDLLITDIQMPHMDGLALLSEVRALYPDTHCILLSAYGEFEYAKKALQLGVENYLLKPLQIDELEETITKALDNIYTSRTISKQLFRNNILSRWINGAISDEELSERASLIDVNLYLPEYCVVCLCKKQPTLSLTNYCKTCAEKLSAHYEVHHFRDERNRYIFIIGSNRIVPKQLLSCFIAEAAHIKISHLLAISVGNVVSNINELPESFQIALSLIDGADMTVPDMLVLTHTQSMEQEESKLMQELNTIFHLQDEEPRHNSFVRLTDNLFQMLEDNTLTKVMKLLTHSLSRLFSQEFPNRPEAQEQLYQRMHLFTATMDMTTFSASVIELLEYSYLLFTYYFEQLSPIIQAAITYIHKHYGDSISIKEFCVKNKMSTPYFGFLFKSETGMFFNNYLTQFRICASIRLLLDTDKKINDIATAVGFSSPSYYILCFKKQTGLSPVKYRARQPLEKKND